MYLRESIVQSQHSLGAWVAQSVKGLSLAQVMISGPWDQAPASGSLFREEPVSPSFTLPAVLALCQIESFLKIHFPP